MHRKPSADNENLFWNVVEWDGVPVGPNALEDGGFDGVVPSRRAGHGLPDNRRCP